MSELEPRNRSETGEPADNGWESLLGSVKQYEDEFKDNKDFYENKPIVRGDVFGAKQFTEEDRAAKIAEAEKAKNEAIETRAEYMDKLQQIQGRTEKDLSEDFSGERNINDKTGKERTFKEWDLYQPTSQDKNMREFGDRLIKNHDLTTLTELLPKEQDETAEEYNSRIKLVYANFPREANEEPAHYKERLKEAHDNNDMLAVVAREMIEKGSKIDQDLQNDLLNIDDMRDGGRFDEERAKVLRREVMMKAITRQREQERAEQKEKKRAELRERLAARKAEADSSKSEELNRIDEEIAANERKLKEKNAEITRDNEELERLEAEAREKISDEERARLEAEAREQLELERKDAEIKAAEEELRLKQDSIEKNKAELKRLELEAEGPLVAINADLTHDKTELARDYAERAINKDAKKSILASLWKGTLFKKYYQKKYEREILSGERTLETADGRQVDIETLIRENNNATIERFTKGATAEYADLVHRNAGEDLTEADARSTESIKSAIEEFAKAPEEANVEDLKREFMNKIRQLEAEGRDNGFSVNSTLLNNYYEVAVKARERISHGIAMDRVMDGFKVYNAEVRNGVRGDIHRDNIDKIVNRLESGRITQFIPAEIIAGALGTATALTQTGARALAGIGVGIGVGAAASGLRERNRVTEDRARMMRDIASGLEYGGDDPNAKGKTAKYEARIGGTLYDIRPARELTEAIENAIASGDKKEAFRSLIEAEVRTKFSDAERKDLLAYSSQRSIGDERMALDIAMIKAKKSLPPEYKARLGNLEEKIMDKTYEMADGRDEEFQRFRARRAIMAAGKTAFIGTALFFASQEIMAALDPSKIGIFEKFGLIKNNNNQDASETILARITGPNTREISRELNPISLKSNQTNQIEQLEKNGWKRTEVQAGSSKIERTAVEVDVSKAANAKKLNIEFADNGTTRVDGNELRLHVEDGKVISRLRGNSTMGNRVFNYEDLAADGKIKGYLTVGDTTFEIAPKLNSAGQLTWGENGVFTTTTGENLRAISPDGKNLFRFFRIAVDEGVNNDGSSNIVSLATEVGSNTFNDKITQITETVVEQPATYLFTKTVTEEIPVVTTMEGIVAPIPTAHNGLGEARSREAEQQNAIPRPGAQSTDRITPVNEAIS